MKQPPKPDYSEEETERRLASALRGAREVGHKEMKDIQRKRPAPNPKDEKR
jgi:DNA-binding HxlR family transcriptional regulator